MTRPHPENTKAKMWLWIGVSVFSAIVMVMWGWAASIRLSAFSWEKTPEKELMEKSKNDWDTLFNNEEERIKREQTKLQLKNILSAIVADTNAPGGTASTTETNTASSSIINTSSQTN